MISMGQTYFRKFLKDCEGASITAYVSELEATLSRGMGTTYELEPVSTVRETGSLVEGLLQSGGSQTAISADCFRFRQKSGIRTTAGWPTFSLHVYRILEESIATGPRSIPCPVRFRRN